VLCLSTASLQSGHGQGLNTLGSSFPEAPRPAISRLGDFTISRLGLPQSRCRLAQAPPACPAKGCPIGGPRCSRLTCIFPQPKGDPLHLPVREQPLQLLKDIGDQLVPLQLLDKALSPIRIRDLHNVDALRSLHLAPTETPQNDRRLPRGKASRFDTQVLLNPTNIGRSSGLASQEKLVKHLGGWAAIPRGENPAVSTADLQSRSSLEERVLKILKTANPKTVEQLVDTIRKEEPLLTEEVKEITEILKRLDEAGEIQLIDLSPDQAAETRNHAQDTGVRQGNTWLYLVLSTTIATYAAVYLLPAGDVLVPIRWMLGILLVIFLPGYATVQALFPTRDLDTIERYAFSLALSLAIVSLTAFILNYTPWGVRLDPVVTTLVFYTVCVALIAGYRRYRRRRTR